VPFCATVGLTIMAAAGAVKYGQRVVSPDEIRRALLGTAAEFLDLGAGDGNGLRAMEMISGRRGLGLDLDAAKVAVARRRGRPVLHGDLLDLPPELDVGFVTFDNVLEHLRSPDAVETALSIAIGVARDFVYINHPAFDDEDRLRELGFFRYWTDWQGHPCPLTLDDFTTLFEHLGVESWQIRPNRRILDSADAAVLPIGAGRDQHRYDRHRHGAKATVRFEVPIYESYDILVHLTDPPRASFGPTPWPAWGISRPALHWDDDARSGVGGLVHRAARNLRVGAWRVQDAATRW
jgi:hypothetical protein